MKKKNLRKQEAIGLSGKDKTQREGNKEDN